MTSFSACFMILTFPVSFLPGASRSSAMYNGIHRSLVLAAVANMRRAAAEASRCKLAAAAAAAVLGHPAIWPDW